MGLSDRAILVSVSISQWAGRKMDKKATATVSNMHLNKKGTGNFTKKLLPGAKELDRINAIAGSIRDYFRAQSLPWLADGTRILSAQNYLDFTKNFRDKKSQFETAVNDFLVVYPNLKSLAQSQLGNLYDPADYPDPRKLLRLFSCDVGFMPLPDVTDFRVELSESEKKDFIAKMQSVESTAMQDCYSRLFAEIDNAAKRLADPNANFKNALIDNIQKICDLLPKLNITNDPQLESMRLKTISAIAKMQPDTIRDNKTERKNAADKLAEITNAMGAFMGQNNNQGGAM